MLLIFALSLLGLAVAAYLFVRSGQAERRPELRLTREHELVRRAAEHRRRRDEAARAADSETDAVLPPPAGDAPGPPR